MDADTARISAVANAGLTHAQTAQTQLGTKVLNTATNGGTTVPAGSNIGINVGGASITPSPATTGAQTGAAERTNALSGGVQAYETNGVGAATDIALKALAPATLKDTGKPGAWLSTVTPTQAAQVRTAIRGQVMAANPGMSAADADKQAETLLSSSTPTTLRQQLANGKANYLENKQVRLPAQQDFLAKNNGQGNFEATYVPPARFWNPKTGEVKLSTTPQQDAATLQQGGFVPLGVTK